MKLSKLFGILLVLISISFNSCLIAKDVRKGNKEENYSKEDLELRRKIAQMLILGFRGTELKSSECKSCTTKILCARTACYGAFMNMKINASSLDDKAFVNDILSKGQALIEKADKLEKEYTEIVLKQMSE